MSTPDSPVNGGDFTALADEQEYERYFLQLRRVFRHLVDCYPCDITSGTSEGCLIQEFMQKLLASVELLQLKHAYPLPEERPFWIDVTESGFPNQLEIGGLESDLALKTSLLHDLPALSILKRTLVDELFRPAPNVREILRQLSRRTYLERLSENTVFLPYTPGTICPLASSNKATRSYSYSFACYDFVTNRPYVHLLTMEQNLEDDPLERNAELCKNFHHVLRAEGARAPNIGVLAMALDEALETLHPKMLKRTCFGPLYSKFLLDKIPAESADDRDKYFQMLLRDFGRRDDDFALLLTEEIVFSKRREVSRSMFSGKKSREIFAISEADPECSARNASAVNHYFLLPHELLQHVAPESTAAVREFSNAKKLTIDESGEVHGL